MVHRSVRHQPPRGSTAWGAQQILRLLDEKERIAAERERRLAADSPLQVALLAFGAGSIDENDEGESDTYADRRQQRPEYIGYPNRIGGGRFAGPKPPQHLYELVYARPKPPEPTRRMDVFGPAETIPTQNPATAGPTKAVPDAAARLNHSIRGYGAEDIPLPPGYASRWGGLNDETAERQRSRQAAYEESLRQRAWSRRKALDLLDRESGAEDDSLLADLWKGLFSFSDGEPAIEPPPAAASQVVGEANLVRAIVDAFSRFGVFLWESPETRQDNMDIIRMIEEEVRACGREALHTHGGTKSERILRREDRVLKGSRRTDGTAYVPNPNGRGFIFEFNTIDTRADGRATTREANAAADIIELKREIDKEIKTRFETYPKSRGKDRKRWRAKIRPLVRQAVRKLLNC